MRLPPPMMTTTTNLNGLQKRVNKPPEMKVKVPKYMK
jgi:hypothetical protein